MAPLFAPFFLIILFLPPLDESVPPGRVAVGDQIEITEAAFNDYIISEYAGQELSASLLEQVIQETLIEQEAENRNLKVSDPQLERRIKDLDL
ncbi:MAG: hypothetical protein ABIK28_20115, partial [Planctomycetota bacterium]